MEDQSWSLYDIFQSLDMFNFPISLTHRKKNHFKTALGGFLSLLIYFIMSVVIFSVIKRMMNREDVNIVESTNQIDHFLTREQVYPFENRKFMIGFSVLPSYPDTTSCLHNQTKLNFFKYSRMINEENVTQDLIKQINATE